MGFKVEDLEKAQLDLAKIAESYPEAAPKKIDSGKSGIVRKKELEECILGKYPGADPDGILLDLSETRLPPS